MVQDFYDWLLGLTRSFVQNTTVKPRYGDRVAYNLSLMYAIWVVTRIFFVPYRRSKSVFYFSFTAKLNSRNLITKGDKNAVDRIE